MADLNGDRRLDTADLDVFSAGWRAHNPRFDFTGEGSFDEADVSLYVTRMAGVAFGDSNFDGTFNSADMVLVLQSAEYEDGPNENSTWAEGDWNCDGDFDSNDVILAWQHGSYAALSQAVRSPPRRQSWQREWSCCPIQRTAPRPRSALPAYRPHSTDGAKRPAPRSTPEDAQSQIFADPSTVWQVQSVEESDDLEWVVQWDTALTQNKPAGPV